MTKLLTIKDENIVNIASEFLLAGKIICFPTDTVYALSCVSDNIDSIKKIYDIKKREQNKALIIFCYDIEQICEIAYLDNISSRLSKKFFPGALTLILNSKNNLSNIISKDNTIGVRIPNNEFVLNLIREIQIPIIATSVNISGMKSACNINEIDIEIYNKTDLIIDGGDLISEPSTIIDCTANKAKIIREGAMINEIRSYLLNLLD